jgi:AcrR family transcriptional regulator
MGRARAAVLDGALRSLTKQGVRATTMGDVAVLGGVAKATLYNHFRRKEDVWRALAEVEVRRIVDECVGLATADLAMALATAASRVAEHPAVRRIAAQEPQILSAVSAPDRSTSAWTAAADGVAAMLDAAGRSASPAGVDVVLRWVGSHVGMPGTDASRRAGADLLVAALAPSGQRTPPQVLA